MTRPWEIRSEIFYNEVGNEILNAAWTISPNHQKANALKYNKKSDQHTCIEKLLLLVCHSVPTCYKIMSPGFAVVLHLQNKSTPSGGVWLHSTAIKEYFSRDSLESISPHLDQHYLFTHPRWSRLPSDLCESPWGYFRCCISLILSAMGLSIDWSSS